MMTTTRLSIVAAIILTATSSFAQTLFTGKPQYQIEVRRADTLWGKIVVEMFPAIAPNHVRNWDSLVTIHFYDSTAFHRVIPGFMIQGGDPNSRSGPKSTWGYGEDGQQTVDAEFSSVSHLRGVLSAARAQDINSATSQFFICVGNPTYLDGQYSIYGHVVSGLNYVDSIVKAKRDSKDNPLVKISMFITKIGSNDSVTTPPELVSPTTKAAIVADSAVMVWRRISDAMMYRVQVATNENFENVIFDNNLSQKDTTATINDLQKGKQYFWRVLANNGGHESEYSQVWNFKVEAASGVQDNTGDIHLNAVYPNPATKAFSITFQLDKAAPLTIMLFNLLGQKVATVISSEYLTSGVHTLPVRCNDLAPGKYLYTIEANSNRLTNCIIIE
jgi:peptidyl-prolyl cis-trans isomerase B (cyclophilin B)